MARPALATIAELETALDQDVPVSQAESLLARASAIVRAYARETWLDETGDLAEVPDDIPGVVVSMVERATRNPSGITQEQSGPFGRSFGPAAASKLYLTRPEKSVIRSAIGSVGVGVLSTTRGDLETAPVIDPFTDGTLDEDPPWPS